jgi:hypothetical protein
MLTEEQSHLSTKQQRPLHTSAYFIIWLKDTTDRLSDRETTDYLETGLNLLDVQLTDHLRWLVDLLSADKVNLDLGEEYFECKIFDETARFTRQRINRALYKNSESLQLYRKLVKECRLPNKKGVEFNLIQAVLAVPEAEWQIEERRELLKQGGRQQKKTTTTPPLRRNALDGSEEGSDAEFTSQHEQAAAPNRIRLQRGGTSAFIRPDDDTNSLVDGEGSTGDDGGGRHQHRGAVESSGPKRKKSSMMISSDDDEEDVARKRTALSSSPDDASPDDELMTFLHNSQMMDDSIKTYAVTLKYKGMNLIEALQNSNAAVADVLIEAVFEACCVDDICEDISTGIIRDQNVAAFHNLKRLVSGCRKDQVVTFNFPAFFRGVRAKVYDRLKIVRNAFRAEDGSKRLMIWQQRENEKLSLWVKKSVHKVKLRTIYVYSHINDQLNLLDMKQFRKCGFLSIHQGVVRDCKIPLTAESLLEITGTTSYTPEDMEAFTKETLGTKVLKSDVPSLQALKEEKQVKRKVRKEQKAASPSSVAENIAAVAKAKFLHAGPLALDDDDDDDNDVNGAALEALVQGVLSSPLAPASPRLPTSPLSVSTECNLSPSSDLDTTRASSRSSRETSLSGDSPSLLRHDVAFSSPSSRASPASNAAPLREVAASTSPTPPPRASISYGRRGVADDVDVDEIDSRAAPSSPADVISLLRTIFRDTEGSHDAIKLKCFFKPACQKFMLSLVEIVSLVVLNTDSPEMVASDSCVADVTFKFFRAYGVDEDGSLLASMNTQGDGYCHFRASKQAEERSEDRTLTVSALKRTDSKVSSDQLVEHINMYLNVVHFADPYTHMFHKTKLEECLFNAENFVDKVNPRSCWGEPSWTRFVAFDFALLDFSVNEPVTIGGLDCKWGLLQCIPFHYFETFFVAGVPTLTLTQLHEFTRKANYVGFCSGHNFLLENPPSCSSEGVALDGAVIDWISKLTPSILALSRQDLASIRAFGVSLRAKPTVSIRKTIDTAIGRIDVDAATEVAVVQFNAKNQPMCTDTLFAKGKDGGINQREAVDLLETVRYSVSLFIIVCVTSLILFTACISEIAC